MLFKAFPLSIKLLVVGIGFVVNTSSLCTSVYFWNIFFFFLVELPNIVLICHNKLFISTHNTLPWGMALQKNQYNVEIFEHLCFFSISSPV